ncbi:MAG: hypothetical protein K0S61_140 [Anaerocolumna sp.]|jgi:hypothetical protein|nr:hypothetical protein [Anaerocolumna sp.]
MNSILISTKKLLGYEQDFTQFDPDIILFINSVMLSLNQLGVGPSDGFEITGEEETWTDLFGDRKDLSAVKTYVYLKVRLLFDPPTNESLIKSIERQIIEAEWRINAQSTQTVEGGV